MAPFKWLILFIIDSKSLKRVNFNLNDLRSLKIKSVYTNHDDRCFKFQLIPALADECSTMKHQFINIFIFLSFSFFLISAKISESKFDFLSWILTQFDFHDFAFSRFHSQFLLNFPEHQSMKIILKPSVLSISIVFDKTC